jgi:hypothetical protein
MSKRGLFAHFGPKEELQLAAIDTAEHIFDGDVVTSARADRPSPDPAVDGL